MQRRCQKIKRARIAKVVLLCVGLILLALGLCYQSLINTKSLPSLYKSLNVEKDALESKNSILIGQKRLMENKQRALNEANSSNEEINNDDTLRLNPTVKQLPTVKKIELKAPIEEVLLKNFHLENTFATASILAQFYFEKKEYGKAIEWAKESSKLEPVSDKPWLIYAKTKFHLGERAEAVRSLELFLGYVNSNEVKELLNFYKGQQ